MSKKHHILAVGAHCGDMEIAVGAIANKYAKQGHRVTFLHFTAGEKGTPAHLSVEEYREQKIRESEEAFDPALRSDPECRSGSLELSTTLKLRWRLSGSLQESRRYSKPQVPFANIWQLRH